MVLIASLLFYSARDYEGFLSVSFVLLFCIVSFSPLLIFKKEPIFSLLKIMPLIYFIFFPLSYILTWIGVYDSIPFYELDSYNIALYYVLIAFYFFYLPLLFVGKKNNDTLSIFDKIKSVDADNIVQFTKFFTIATFIVKGLQFIMGSYFFLTVNDSRYYSIMFNFGFFNLFINSFQYLAIFFLYVGWQKYHILKYKNYLIVFVVFLTLFNIPTGSKQAMFTPFFFLLACFNIIDKKNVSKFLIVLFLLYISTKSIISDYREAVVSGDVDVGFDSIAEVYTSSDYNSVNTGNAFKRISLLNVVKSVFDYTPKYYPYEGFGELLYDSAIVFIPRFLWSDKPIISKGNLMGKQYDIINYNNDSTSVGISLIADFFRYGGLLFVILGMFLLGLLYAYLEKSFNSGFGFSRFFYIVMFINNFLWIERDLTSIYYIFIYAVTFLLFIFFVSFFNKKDLYKNGKNLI